MDSTDTDADLWVAPGPGHWRLGRHTVRPLTPLAIEARSGSFRQGFATGFARVGVPLRHLDEQIVNGVPYVRAVPLIDKPGSRPPPRFASKLAMRIHPQMRTRNKQAKLMIDEESWREWLDRWYTYDEPAWSGRHQALQRIDPDDLDGDQLGRHLDACLDNARAALIAHFELAPIESLGLGRLLVEGADRWGLSPTDIVPVLAGASPATTTAQCALDEVRRALVGSVDTLDDVRAVPEASVRLDRWLERHGWWILTGYDLDARTIGEVPSAIVAALNSPPAPEVDGTVAINALVAKIPKSDRQRAHKLIEDARECLALRDAIGPCTAEWPIGLVRRGALAIGRRAGLTRPDHALEANRDELIRLIQGERGPDEDDLAQRRTTRYDVGLAGLPEELGDPEPDPPIDAMPAPLAHTTRVGLAVMALEWDQPATETVSPAAVHGVGIGERTVSGRARVIYDPRGDLDLLPGDILVAPSTTPTWSMLLTQAAALVVEEGGLAAHSAIVARELNIAAVIGARDACRHIRDKTTIEVDPITGTVRSLPDR